MKNFVFIIILSIFLKPVFPVLEYVINYDYITTKLCVNKDKPMLKCNGKCHLKQELAKEANTDNSKSNEQKNNSISFEVLFCQNIPIFTLSSFYNSEKKVQTLYTRIYFRLNSTSIFHPPILA